MIATLGSRIIIEKRIVYDGFMMLGDVGGLGDFFFLALASLIGLVSGHFEKAHLA